MRFNPIQLKVIQTISKRLCELMNIPILAMRGVIWNALSECQIKYNKTTAEITQLPIGKRMLAAKEIFNIGKEKIKSMLNEPNEQNEILLDIIFEKAFKYYMEYNKKFKI